MKRLKHYWSRCINYKILIQTSFIVGLLSNPSVSFAQDIEGVINNAAMYLQGRTARAFGILCIIIIGYLCLARQVFPKESFMMVLLGLGVIFGSASLYGILIGI